LEDSSLVAKKLATEERVLCAAPSYIEAFDAPKDLLDLEMHNCLSAGALDVWRLEGPDGPQQFRAKGNIRSNSGELIREAVFAGIGISLLSTWDIGPALSKGELQIVLPQYRGMSSDAIYAVYPSRDFMPSKVNVFIEFLSDVYGLEPYWNEGIDLKSMAAAAS